MKSRTLFKTFLADEDFLPGQARPYETSKYQFANSVQPRVRCLPIESVNEYKQTNTLHGEEKTLSRKHLYNARFRHRRLDVTYADIVYRSVSTLSFLILSDYRCSDNLTQKKGPNFDTVHFARQRFKMENYAFMRSSMIRINVTTRPNGNFILSILVVY